jgi:nucleoside-diphosphate-sugar epimerase
MEDVVASRAFWRDRPTFVTGATGLVGGWLVKRLVDLGADVVCLVRDWAPTSELMSNGPVDRIKIVRGNVRHQAALERVGECEIDTVAAAYTLLAERLAAAPDLKGQAFNFSNEIQVTVLDLTRRVLALMGSSLEPEVLNRATHEIRHQYLSAAKAKAALRWEALYTLDEGLRRTVAWYHHFLGAAA